MKKILIIEDNDTLRENTMEILELSNYKVYGACNGKEGIEMAIHTKPDIIVCDIMMPEVDGYGVLHMIQKNEELKHTPFIFLSAKAERTDFRKGMELGADDYIAKPFTATELLTAVESRLKKSMFLKEEIAQGIQGVNDLLKASGKEKWETFTKGRNAEKYKKKQAIYHEGNRPHYLYYIQKGKVKAFKRNEEGKELVTGLFHEGDFFGYIALMEGTSYKDTTETMEESEIAFIPKDEFEELMNCNREISSKFIKLLAKNVSDKEQQLLNIAYNSLRKKVADAILMMHEKLQKEGREDAVLDIGRENMAAIAGTATESLIRTLGDFKSEKLIDIKDGSVVILNKNKLKNMLN
jgi:cAMP-binding proteins - catabolite gene activator and regulatory subunit of cAMP-dependent protein kinases